MNQPPIENLMKNTLEQLKGMIDVDTIVGDVVGLPGGGVVIPISRVSFGFFAGGGEYGPMEKGGAPGAGYPFAGGAGAGVSLQPQAFLVVADGQVRIMHANCNNPYERILELLPNLMQEAQKWLRCKCGEAQDACCSQE